MAILRSSFRVLLTLSLFVVMAARGQEMKNGLEWYTDINKANEVATKTGKPLFAFFTGSDWCGWCHKLHADVFDKPGFKEWAKKNVILVEVDFPRRKQLPQELAQQNAGLQQAFNVQGYPTCWIFNMTKDATGKFSIAALGQLGYPRAQRGEEETTFINDANKILKNK